MNWKQEYSKRIQTAERSAAPDAVMKLPTSFMTEPCAAASPASAGMHHTIRTTLEAQENDVQAPSCFRHRACHSELHLKHQKRLRAARGSNPLTKHSATQLLQQRPHFPFCCRRADHDDDDAPTRLQAGRAKHRARQICYACAMWARSSQLSL